MNAIPERLKPGEPLPDLRGLKYDTSTTDWPTTCDQDVSCLKEEHASIENNLSNSFNSLHSKILKSESNVSNTSGEKLKTVLPFNNDANYNLPLTNIENVMSPIIDPFHDYTETDLDQPTDYSIKYAEHTSDDDKQSSAYFTCTEQDTVKTYCTEGTPYQGSLNSSRASSASDLHEESRLRAHFRKISEYGQKGLCNGSKHLSINAATEQNFKPQNYIRVNSRPESLRSTTNSGKHLIDPLYLMHI
jgi:adenomatosis polyposis coli protein